MRLLFNDSQGDEHPITPVMLGDARLAVEFSDEMLGLCTSFLLLVSMLCHYHCHLPIYN